MDKLKNTQLIVTDEGAIYHINIRPENLAENIIIVGDPGRVDKISCHFDEIEFKGQNREIKTHTGRIANTRITAMSTGMGPDNIDIVLNELDALANIDLQNKTIKKEHKVLNIIRLGTSGAVQKEIPVDSFIASKYGLGLDGLMNFYNPPKGIIENKMVDALIEQTNWPSAWAKPYIVKGTNSLLGKVGFDMLQGITATAPGFYGPQGRNLRMKLAQPDFNQRIEAYRFGEEKIFNYEMETSALYGLGRSLGHNVLTVCLVIANRITEAYSTNHHQKIEELIRVVLERISDK